MTHDVAQHENPARRADANFVIFAHLGDPGLNGRWEQLWARHVESDTFQVCCIPYFTYGIALGDVVRTSPAHGKKFVVAEVVAKSGRQVVRLWLKHARPGTRERLTDVLSNLGLLSEWRTSNLVAIDVAGDVPGDLQSIFTDAEELGVMLDWGS